MEYIYGCRLKLIGEISTTSTHPRVHVITKWECKEDGEAGVSAVSLCQVESVSTDPIEPRGRIEQRL